MKKLLSLTLITLAAACIGPKNQPLPNPTSTTAILFASNFFSGQEVQAIDVKTRVAGQVLGADAVAGDSLVRVFGETLYLIGRDFAGQNNNVTLLDPTKGYTRVCESCQWPLGEAVNVQDFWAVSKKKAYLTTAPASMTAPAYEHRNDVWIMNPLTGEISGYIDIAAGLRAQGDNLADKDTDGTHELGALFSDDQHLFVVVGTLTPSFSLVPGEGDCPNEPARVAVIDLDTDKVVKVIKLSGANPSGRFIPEPGTDNVLIATPGSLGNASVDSCGGIERIDQVKLTLKEPLYTEAQLSGSVVSFDLDANQDGVVFLFTAGGFLDPTYEVRRFQKGKGIVGDPLSAPGSKGFTQPSFVEVNDRGEAYVGLPLASGPQIGMWEVATGKPLADPIKTTLPPIDVAFFPGQGYYR